MGGPTGIAMQNAMNKVDGFGEVVDYRGAAVLAAWGYAPTLDVGVVTKVDRDEALSGVNSLRWIGMGLLALTLLGVIPLALIVARSFSRPMRDAVDVAKRLPPEIYDPGQNRGCRRNGIAAALHCRDEQPSSQPDQTYPGIDRSGHVDDKPDRGRGPAARKNDPGARQLNRGGRRRGEGDLGHQPRINADDGDVQSSAVQAGDLATAGQGGLTGMQRAMQGLAASTDSISSRLSVISDRANNINLAVITITKVADQTNLLSINAAIEAEKAGEAGRGFLVVAREIRRLADQTAAATLDIERIVKEMQQSVTAGVMEMDKFNEQVRRGVEDVDQIGGKLGEVIAAVQHLLPRFQQVTEKMSAQSVGAEQIREAMAQLSDGAAHTSESIREFHKATDQLREAIGRLRDDISKFRT